MDLIVMLERTDFLSWFDYPMMAQVRRVCRAARDAVSQFRWDLGQNISRISGARDQNRRPKAPYGGHAYEYVAHWHRCCPHAVTLTVDRVSLLHGDGAKLAGLRRLELCSEVGEGFLRLLSGRSRPENMFDLDNALAHARSLLELRVECDEISTTIASASAFVALTRLRYLELIGTPHGERRAPARSLDAIFAPLAALETLLLVEFGRNIGPALGGANLAGLRRLELRRCAHVALTDAELLSMTSLQELTLESCPSVKLSPRAFAGRVRLYELTIDSCGHVHLSDAAFVGLVNLRLLQVRRCPARLTRAAVRDLPADCRIRFICCPGVDSAIIDGTA